MKHPLLDEESGLDIRVKQKPQPHRYSRCAVA
jgi:hypothetical protein